MRMVPRFDDPRRGLGTILDEVIQEADKGKNEVKNPAKEKVTKMELPVSVIRYFMVEMVVKNATRDAKAYVGMFHGLRTRSHEGKLVRFAILSDDNERREALTAYCLDDYNFLSVKFEYGDTKELTVFRNTDEDQKLAYEFMVLMLERMKTEKKMMDGDAEIIGRNAYSELPDELAAKKKPTTTTRPASYTAPGFHGATGGYSGGYNNEDWEKKRKAEEEEKKRRDEMRKTPFLLKRTSEVPQKVDLNEIKRKVLAIKTGEYKAAIPTFSADATPATEATEPEEDAHSRYLGQFGGE